jgi:ribosomal-protein-alanine N-acetyltransferase
MEIINFEIKYIELFLEFINRNEKDLFFFHPHNMEYNTIKSILTNNKNDKYKIVLFENKIIGYGILRGWDEGFEIPSLGIIIDKDYRGLGLSKLLINYLEFIAKISKSEKIRIVVHKNNLVAYNLYKKMNYEFTSYNENQLISFKNI